MGRSEPVKSGPPERLSEPAGAAPRVGEASDTPVPPLRSGWAERVISGTLLVATLLSTMVAGALLQGNDPLGLAPASVGALPIWVPTGLDLGALLGGTSFALPFLLILLGHEWAHRIAAARHGIRTTLPYCIPFPPHISVVGSLGAFIRIRSPVPSRRALLDVGVSGPLASLALAIPILAVGLILSVPAGIPAPTGLPFVIHFQDVTIRLGQPLLVRGIAWSLGLEGGTEALLLHPLAFAGWLGLMLTLLNLLPLARLDGGHILHALHPARAGWGAVGIVVAFLLLGFVWRGWWAWAAVMVLLGRSRPLPPGFLPPSAPPGRARRRVAYCALGSIVLLLPPIPVGL